MTPIIQRGEGQTHYFGDGCNPPHQPIGSTTDVSFGMGDTPPIIQRFREKAKESFARGGFLTTDYPGEDGVNQWELDPMAIESFILTELQIEKRRSGRR